MKRSDLLSVETQTGDLSTQEFQKVPTVLGPCVFFFLSHLSTICHELSNLSTHKHYFTEDAK